jgi:uncharacterized Zn-binding protein involved in type VI secretion
MASVAIHPPKTPVTAGSMGIAQNTVPNVCKMPGPPAPFVPTPLPNIGKSGMSPQGFSTTVKIEGNAVAIMGASFGSMGDIASKGTGGGMISCNCEGPTKFIAPGSFTVKIEGKNVHLLSDIMSNNNGPGGSPPNAATMMGLSQADAKAIATAYKALCKEFCKEVKNWKSSKTLEDRLRNNPTLKKMGIEITPRISHVLGGVAFLTIPDAMQTLTNGNKQCFDFKGPGDRWRNNQRARQTRLAKRVPKEVSRKKCGC